MKAIGNFFSGFNTFLNNCVSYTGSRIFNGKFIEDIKFLINSFNQFVIKICSKSYHYLSKVKFFRQLVAILSIITFYLLKIPFLSILYSFLAETIKTVFYCYSEIFIVFAITFPASILLLDWFQTSIIFFCIAFIPFVLCNILCFSALYYCIDRRENGEKITFWQSIVWVKNHAIIVFLPFIAEISLIAECIAVFVFIAFSLIFLFEAFNITWSNSFIYIFIVIFSGSLLLIGIFSLILLANQTFFAVLFDGLPFHQAIKQSQKSINKSLFWYLFFYLFLFVYCAIYTWHAFLTNLYLGLSFGLYLTTTTSTFLGYLLRKKFITNHSIEVSGNNRKLYQTLNIIIIFGVINYSLLSNLLIKEYQPITTLIQMQQDDYLASQNVKTYDNKKYGYEIQYPLNWSMYQWQSNSVTFYNNYTQTLSGGTWMTIAITPSKDSNFNQLYDAVPGVIPNNLGSEDQTTKITNLDLQGYRAVSYLLIHPNPPYIDYESHYTILKKNQVYDISFTSVTNDISNYNSDLFTKIISSFKFIQ